MRKLAPIKLFAIFAFLLSIFLLCSRPVSFVSAYARPADPAISLHSASVTLTRAEIENLDSVQPIVVPAPGAGKINVPLSVTWQYKAGSTPYTPFSPNQFFGVTYGNIDAAFVAAQTGFIDQTTNQVQLGLDGGAFQSFQSAPQIVPISDAQTIFENMPLLVGANSAPSGGNGTLTVTVSYIIITLN